VKANSASNTAATADVVVRLEPNDAIMSISPLYNDERRTSIGGRAVWSSHRPGWACISTA
jgi:hypothetical protein